MRPSAYAPTTQRKKNCADTHAYTRKHTDTRTHQFLRHVWSSKIQRTKRVSLLCTRTRIMHTHATHATRTTHSQNTHTHTSPPIAPRDRDRRRWRPGGVCVRGVCACVKSVSSPTHHQKENTHSNTHLSTHTQTFFHRHTTVDPPNLEKP